MYSLTDAQNGRIALVQSFIKNVYDCYEVFILSLSIKMFCSVLFPPPNFKPTEEVGRLMWALIPIFNMFLRLIDCFCITPVLSTDTSGERAFLRGLSCKGGLFC